MKENEKLKNYKLQQQQREKRLAEERIKQAGILNTRIANQKNQQRDYYIKYLRDQVEHNKEQLRKNDHKYHNSQLPKLDT